MGCDIHVHGERRKNGKWEYVGEGYLENRSYGTFGFLADVRNYSDVSPIANPRGLPEDISGVTRIAYQSWYGDAHTPSWLSLEELLNFDYDQVMEDRRCTRFVDTGHGNGYYNGGSTCDPGDGKKMTYREFLGENFFVELDYMKDRGVERIVFWFDN